MSTGVPAAEAGEIIGFLEPDASPARPGGGETVSRFGGLWIDRRDWIDILAAKHRSGEISDALSDKIFRFVRDGYVVLEGAVPRDVVDRINADVDNVWRQPPEGMRIETWADGTQRYVPPAPDYRLPGAKLLDLYAFSEAARQAIAAPAAVEFLSAIFAAAPKAFQSLTFDWGSQQAMHKDSAYVRVDREPLHMAATWLALEDVAEGAGALEYYVGSHRAPDFLFAGDSKWMEAAPEEHDRFLASLHADAERYGHTRQMFLGSCGDLLVWHADLAHGGSPVKEPGLTRRSLVTHFAPVADSPIYRRRTDYREAVSGGCHFVSEHGDVG